MWACVLFCGSGEAGAEVTQIVPLAERVAPWLKGKVVTEEIPSEEGKDVFEISTRDGKLLIKANSAPAAGMGLNHYLRHFCKRHYALTGKNMTEPEVLPEVTTPVRRVSSSRYRHLFNFCTMNYSFSFQTWDDWEKVIDFMALNGVNLALTPLGQEEVWYNTLKKFNFSEKEIFDFLPGPAFNAWHMMGNHEGWGGPVTQGLMKRRSALAGKVFDRMRELEIAPIYISFYGMVPNRLKEKYPEARIMDQGNWVGGFKRPAVLVPSDPLYGKMADVYYEELKNLYGEFHYFAGEPFHEGGNRQGISVSDLAVDVLKIIRRHNPQAIWVLQGWSGNPSTEFLSRLDKEKDVLIWDFRGELAAEWEQRKGYEGFPYLWGVINNFGETPGLYGRLERFSSEFSRARTGPYGKNMAGLGASPEGCLNNPVNFDLLFDLPWHADKVDVPSWISQYAEYRYGRKCAAMQEAWGILLETAYSSETDKALADPVSKALPSIVGNGESVICAPPALGIRSASSWGSSKLFYDYKRMRALAPCLKSACSELADSETFRYDLVDFTRQLLSNEFRGSYEKLCQALTQKDKVVFEEEAGRMVMILEDMDKLLNTRKEFMVGPWLAAARAMGQTEEEKTLCERNARAQITYWGPDKQGTDLRDYAHKEWGGLVKDVHLPRWKAFIKNQRSLLNGGAAEPFHNTAFEIEWGKKSNIYPAEPQGDTIEVALEILGKWEKTFAE